MAQEIEDRPFFKGIEAPYLGLFERSFSAIVFTDLEGAIVACNELFGRRLGLRRGEIVGTSLVRLASPDSAPDFLLALRRVGDGCFVHYSFDATLAPPRGGLALVEVRATRFELEGEEPRMAFVFNDVTERILAERAMALAIAEKESLLQEIRHRVGNNLQIIASLMRLTKSRYPDGVNFAEAILSRVETMALLYQNMIEDEGIANIHLGDFIDELMRDTRGLYELGEDDFVVETRIEDPGAIDGDRILPVGLFIAEAARAFIEEEGAGVRLRIGLRGRDGGLELEIASRAQRLPAAYSDEGSDEALLFKVLADQLHGRLELRDGSEDDAEGWTGSRFVICLPADVSG